MSENTTWPVDLEPITFTPEQWVLQFFTNFELLTITQFEKNILVNELPLGPYLTSFNEWLSGVVMNDILTGPPNTFSELKEEANSTLNLQQ
jgi:hypothetical protein